LRDDGQQPRTRIAASGCRRSQRCAMIAR
jgi:hypothetical protein